ncbi:MAG: hypothetical protein J6N18_12605 [Kiritimatiellae bacterium]|nr:hypothetical protein [Kiritimatiellia bacterium]
MIKDLKEKPYVKNAHVRFYERKGMLATMSRWKSLSCQYKITFIVIVVICALGCMWYVQRKRSIRSIVKVTPNNEQSSERTNVVSLAIVQNDNNKSSKNTIKRTMRFLELALQLVSPESRSALQKVIDAGVDKQPDSFAKLGIEYMELFGYFKKNGKLPTFYDLLKEGLEKSPEDINLLRMLSAVASIPSMNKRDEYEYYLSKLAEIDTHEDVIFPYAKVILEKGDSEKAYSLIQQTVVDHPEQAVEILTNALWLFDKHKATVERDSIARNLMGLPRIDAFRASRCGDIMFKAGELDCARFFYERCLSDSTSDFLNDLSNVRLCTIAATRGDWNNKTVERLNILAKNSSVPAVRHEASKTLLRIGVNPPNKHQNFNSQKSNIRNSYEN